MIAAQFDRTLDLAMEAGCLPFCGLQSSDLPISVMFTCIKPMCAPILAGNFSRENALYGATTCVVATCHAEPKRVTENEISAKQ